MEKKMILPILAAIGGVGALISAGVGIANSVQNKTTADQNQANVNTTWQREDNATQRRVMDLKAAGLSPVLAAGSPAAASMAPFQTAPRIEDVGSPISQGVQAAMSLITMDQNLSESKQRITTLRSQESLNNEKAYTENYNRKWHSDKGLSMNPDPKTKMFYDGEEYLRHQLKRGNDAIELEKNKKYELDKQELRKKGKDPEQDIQMQWKKRIQEKKDTIIRPSKDGILRLN